MRKENRPSKKMMQVHAELIAKTAKKLFPELKDYQSWNRKSDMQKFEKNLNLLNKNAYGVMPIVGMGCTTGAGSDCYPHTIVMVAEDLSYICTTSDDSKHVGKPRQYGEDGNFVYTTNWEAARTLWTLRKDGHYYPEGVGMGRSYNSISVGHRRYYQDPSF
jgi:hypothetical protein